MEVQWRDAEGARQRGRLINVYRVQGGKLIAAVLNRQGKIEEIPAEVVGT